MNTPLVARVESDRLFRLTPPPTPALVSLPHEPGAFERAREVLRRAAPWVPWGELA